jgi:hypothetical protein
MTGTDLFMLVALGVLGVAGVLFGCVMYRDGYRRGYGDGAWDEKYPEWADGPLYLGPNDVRPAHPRRRTRPSSPSR